jgi:hypothetical protein
MAAAAACKEALSVGARDGDRDDDDITRRRASGGKSTDRANKQCRVVTSPLVEEERFQR